MTPPRDMFRVERQEPHPGVPAPIELVILDFDGVVADSEVLSLSTLRNALGAHGVEMTAEDVMRDFLGRSIETIRDLAAQHCPDCSLSGLAETWQATLFAAFRQSLEPIGSVLCLLDHLDRNGVPYCVASSSSHERLGVALDAMNLAGRFRHLFSAEEVGRGKPFPDLFLHAAERMGVMPERCFVIEDSPFGVKAARRANMRCAGFVGGSHLVGLEKEHARRLMEHGAEIVVSSHEALISENIGLSFSAA